VGWCALGRVDSRTARKSSRSIASVARTSTVIHPETLVPVSRLFPWSEEESAGMGQRINRHPTSSFRFGNVRAVRQILHVGFRAGRCRILRSPGSLLAAPAAPPGGIPIATACSRRPPGAPPVLRECRRGRDNGCWNNWQRYVTAPSAGRRRRFRGRTHACAGINAGVARRIRYVPGGGPAVSVGDPWSNGRPRWRASAADEPRTGARPRPDPRPPGYPIPDAPSRTGT